MLWYIIIFEINSNNARKKDQWDNTKECNETQDHFHSILVFIFYDYIESIRNSQSDPYSFFPIIVRFIF